MSDQPTAPLDSIRDVSQLELLLSEPNDGVVSTMARIDGDLLILGAAGKIGPSLARMARRASDAAGVKRRIIGVDKHATPEMQDRLAGQDVELIRCDLLQWDQLRALPDVPNVIYMAAMKFGASGQEALTWGMNTYLPGMVCQRFPHSRIVAYSTGNVYPMVRPDSGGSAETDSLSPVGDYAMSCLGRERIFAYFSQRLGTPVCLIRLNYAHELRYGIMVDIAQQVMAEQPIDVTMGYFNAIWQGDANAMVLRALGHVAAPPRAVNVAGPDTLSVRQLAEQFSRLMDKPVRFTGEEAADALLSNGRLGYELLGRPAVTPEQMVQWIADWQLRGGPTLGKPTKFQVRDGKF